MQETTGGGRKPRLAGDERSLSDFAPHLRQLSLIVGELTV
jgi:hypothetical protein